VAADCWRGPRPAPVRRQAAVVARMEIESAAPHRGRPPATAKRRAATETRRRRRSRRRGRAALPPFPPQGPATADEPRLRAGGGGAAGLAGRGGATRMAAAARRGTTAPTAAFAPAGAKLGGCGCAVAACGTNEAAAGRRRGRHPPRGVAELRLVGAASGDAAMTGMAKATSSGAAASQPRHAPAEEAQAAGRGGGVAVAACR